MKRILTTIALSALTIAPASADAADHHALQVFHAAQAIAVPLVIHDGHATTVQLFVTPLASPVVIVPLAAPSYSHFALPLKQHRSAVSRCR
jgi:hypothetical protein